MQPTDKLIAELFWSKIDAARQRPPGERLLNGPRLFDYACTIMESGIRHQFPQADDEQVERILHQRLTLGRRLDGADILTSSERPGG